MGHCRRKDWPIFTDSAKIGAARSAAAVHAREKAQAAQKPIDAPGEIFRPGFGKWPMAQQSLGGARGVIPLWWGIEPDDEIGPLRRCLGTCCKDPARAPLCAEFQGRGTARWVLRAQELYMGRALVHEAVFSPFCDKIAGPGQGGKEWKGGEAGWRVARRPWGG